MQEFFDFCFAVKCAFIVLVSVHLYVLTFDSITPTLSRTVVVIIATRFLQKQMVPFGQKNLQ